MKILFITFAGSTGYGGIAKYNDYFIKTLCEIKEVKNVTIFSRKEFGFINEKIKNTFLKNKILFFLYVNFNFHKIIKSNVIIVSHINFLPSIFFALILRKKVVLMTYGLEIWKKKKLFFASILIKYVNFFINMREFTQNVLIEKYDIQNKNHFLLPNFVIGKIEKIKDYKIKNLISVARLDKNERFKGIDETLESLVFFKHINFKYFIIGDGDDKKRLVEKSNNLGLKNCVIFMGRVSDHQRNLYLKKSHIFIMPGSDKTFDTYPGRFVFLEAALFGLQIIASIPPKIEHKTIYEFKNFNYVNPNDKKQIFEMILKLQNKPKEIDYKYLNHYSLIKFKKKIEYFIKNIN